MTVNKNAGPLRSGNWNENNFSPLSGINCRASMVPAALVIRAPLAHVKVIAVNDLIVGFLAGATDHTLCV